ncbi:septal ring lytic transglycosylase RlpA family protein [Bartonella sp. F02]|uniref:septal ring lytic transglycosylase RlpA family protein n=1 Tax=Bartonella sp. F02 TaxID=2967262 RepID=UPI0022A97E6F|nr:septal ring lytic transglycosylase RlpA family protein [Bartonella sp. F02]MCZ2328268.1 septal ring lytic transglycosylase RlpA family protein [Bartonella sp. F02]
MFSNSKESFISIIKPVSKISSLVIVTQILVACANQATQLTVKDRNHVNKLSATKTKAVSDIKNVSSKQNKLKRKNSKRAIIGKPYQIKGKWYYPKEEPDYKRVGQASWYGSDFHGRLTANGEIYDMNLLTAAHPTMPLPSYARVTNLENGSSIIVRVNDRGPFMKDRIIDLSKQAATMLGYETAGVANVEVEYVSEAPINNYDKDYLMASYTLGKYASPMLALADVPEEKKSNALFVLSEDSQKRLIQAIMTPKHQTEVIHTETTFINLPKVGPLLSSKPKLFNQIASAN